MPKRLILNAFTMNTLSHTHHGGWRNPSSRQLEFGDLELWKDYARVAERGALDAIFLADVVGLGDGYRGSSDVFIRNGVHVPANDPMVLVAALVGATENLGFAFTSSILQQHPFHFARQISTLDHLSKGRIGWNIVNSALINAFRNFGFEEIVSHDERYVWAQEYVDVAYKLWEGSWEDDAVLRDVEGAYADPSRVHTIDHVGGRYRVQGPHLVEPSPQRTPLLYQAGNSSAGRAFAALNAEVEFLALPTPQVAAEIVRDVRARAVAFGRRPEDIRFVQSLSFVVGSTEEEAQRKREAYDEYLDLDAVLAHQSRDAGIDFGRFDLDTPVTEIHTDAIRSVVQGVIDATPAGQVATVGDIARIDSGKRTVVGTPEQIADELELWQAAGVDGINISCQTVPGALEEFVDHVVPELQRRGLAQREYAPGTLRERIFGEGPRLPDRHRAASFRQSVVASV